MLAAALAFAAWPAAAQVALDPALGERVRALVAPGVQLQGAAAKARVEIEVGQIDARLRLAPCRRIEPQLPPLAALWGGTRIALRCVEGEKPWQVWLPVTVKVLAPALVPVRALPMGTVLAAEHLQLAEIDWAASAQPPFARAEQVLGRTLGRAWQAGEPLRAADLRARQWFAAGEPVQVLARGEGFAVGGEAQAMGPGIEGQPVRVRTESGRVLVGLPVGERRVELSL